MIKIDRSNISRLVSIYRKGNTAKKGMNAFVSDRVAFLQLLLAVDSGTKKYIDIVSSTLIHDASKNSMINAFKPVTKRTKYFQKTGHFTFGSSYRHLLGDITAICNWLSNAKNLNMLLGGLPANLVPLETKFNTIFSKAGNQADLVFVVKMLISYPHFQKQKTKHFNGYDLAALLDTRACVYCNRQYTLTVVAMDEITRPEFDHFYSQSEHPLLALSFYNLIPSCHICNATLKGSLKSAKELIHPYLEGFDEHVKFRYKFTKLKRYITDPENFDLFLENLATGKLKNRLDNNLEVFKLKEIYLGHKDLLAEIYVKAKRYDGAYLKAFFKKFPAMKGRTTEASVYQYYFGNYNNPKNFDKRIMAKFTADIVETFKLKL
jgi:hypothetical protein